MNTSVAGASPAADATPSGASGPWSKTPGWYAAYLALAVLNFLALSLSLGLNYRQTNLLEGSIDSYRLYADLLERVNGVARNGIAVSAATSNVFSSRDAQKESADLTLATAEFRKALARLHDAIAGLAAAEHSKVEPKLEAIEREFEVILAEEQQTLSEFAAGRFVAAGQHAAVKVAHFNRLAAHVLGLTQIIRDKQLVILTEQRKRADSVDRFGWWLVFGSAGVTITVFLHAARVRRAMREQQKQRDHCLRAMTEARDQAEHAAHIKSRFLANMSHEIRTPMNGVLGMLDSLGNTRLTLEQAKLLRTANISADLLLSSIDDVLDFSKIEAGMLLIESKPVNLIEVAHHVESLYGVRAAEKLLTLRCGLPEQPLARVQSDTTRLTQLLSNLVSNAIKFTLAGEVVIKLAILDEDTATMRIRFAVSDTGIGLPHDAQAHLFAPFMQADSSTSRRYGGTGLGLAICKQLVTLLDPATGQIGVESEPQKGSTFYFVLRLGKAPVIDEHEGGDAQGIDANARSRFSGRVLVAEDNEVNQQVIETMLKSLGVRATIACNGRDAVDAVRDQRYDLILMDYHMPELDGCDAAAAIRRYEEDHRLDRTPIVAVTASVLKEDKERCLASGMDDFLPKPLRQRTLAATLDKWLPRQCDDTSVPSVEPSADEALLRDWSHLPREYFDLEQLLEMQAVAGESFNTLVEQFHSSAAEALTKIGAAIESDDAVGVRRAAHKFKGAATTLGIRKLGEHCFALELIGQESRMGAAAECLAALEKEYAKVRRYMDACTTEAMPPAA